MDDSTYLFNQTSAERKRIARGASSKKNGSKSKKCTMPSDFLTKSQKKKLNGKVSSYDLSKPMSWKDFKGMPHDLRAEYVRKLVKIGASRKDVADMLDIKINSFSTWMCRNHKGENFFVTSTKPNSDAFLKWYCDADDAQKAPENEKPESTDTVESEAPAETVNAESPKLGGCSPAIMSGNIAFSGNAADVYALLKMMLGEDQEYSFTISFAQT